MASRNDKQRILTGGMQLVPPADKLASGDSLLLENFRIDQIDQLRTRNGTVKTFGPKGSGRFHTFRRSGNARYAGIGGSIWGYNSTCDTEIETGFDGEPLGLAFTKNAVWVMNRAKQRRLYGTLSERWGVPAPTSAATATGGGQLSTLIHEFDSGGTDVNVGINSPPNGTDPFTDYAMKNGSPVVNTTCTADFDSNNYRSGSASLRCAIAGETSITAFVALSSADLRVDGQAQDTDTIRVWLFCSDPSKVTSVSVYVRSKNRTDPDHGFAECAILSPDKILNQSLNSWTQLSIRRRINLDDWQQRIAAAAAVNDQQAVTDLQNQLATEIHIPTFIYTGQGWPQTGLRTNLALRVPSTYPPNREMLNLDWSNISEFGVTFKVSGAVNVGVDRAEAVGTVGENSSGAIQYFVSFENVYGEDGNPGPASNAVIAGTQTVSLSSIPISPDSNTAARRIWRIGGGLAQAYEVGRIPDNTTTSWEDHTTNAQAQADNVVMPTDHDLPPPARGVIGPVFGKLIAFNSDDHPARYWWNNSGQPWFYPGALDDFTGNWQDAGGDDDGILTATDHKIAVWFYKQRTIWRLGGDPVTTDPVKTNSNVSAVGPNAVVNGGAVDYFVGWEGVYRFNGDFEEKISQAIDPIFKGDFVRLADGEFLPPASFTALNRASIALVGDRLRVSYAEQGQSEPNIVAIYHLATGRWGREKYNNLAASAFTCLHYEGPGALMMAGATSSGGYLYGLETEGFWLDDTQAAKAIWQSRFYDQDLPDNFKVYTDVEVDLQTLEGSSPNSTVSMYLVIDNGTKILLGTLTSSNTTKPRFTGIIRVMSEDGLDVGRKAKNAAVRLESDFTGTVIVYGVYLHWYPEERVARSFDSGPTHFGLPERVKEVDYAEFYMTGSGQQLQRVLSSDLPGSLLTHRDDANLTAPNGRGNVRFRLASVIDGRNFRLWIGDNPSGSTFQVHQARARMRPIGEYIDGTIGEYFECAEFSVAPGRVGELKDLLLDYDSTGYGQLVIYADLPGNVLTEVRRYTLPAQSRAPRMFPFETPTLSGPSQFTTALPYGQMFKIRIYPPSGGVTRLHGRAVIRARVIGVYFDGTRGEIWETQPVDLVDGMGIFREIEATLQTEGPMTLEMSTEMPNNDIKPVARFTVDTSTATVGRNRFSGRLPGNIKGHLQRFRLVGPYVARIFDVSVLGRRIQTNDTPWEWKNVPVEVTPDAWAEIKMPVRTTPEEFTWIDLAVDAVE